LLEFHDRVVTVIDIDRSILINRYNHSLYGANSARLVPGLADEINAILATSRINDRFSADGT
jgi:hypothetical protein